MFVRPDPPSPSASARLAAARESSGRGTIHGPAARSRARDRSGPDSDPIRTAVCVEPRNGRLHVFMPPVQETEDYLDLIAAIEETAARLDTPVIIEGETPPR